MKTYAVRTTQKHIDYLKSRLRDTDIKEVWASHRLTPEQALQDSFELSEICWTAISGKVPVFVFGAAGDAFFSNKGIPWLLATNDINNISFRTVRHTSKYVISMLKRFDVLENWVHADNTVSINWLKWCKFKIEDPEPYGYDGSLFRRFWIERSMLCA